MGRILKALFVLLILGFIGLTGYAYLGNMSAQQEDIVVPVTLDGN